MRLEGKVAIVTGGASGMGASTARIFAARGLQGRRRRPARRRGQEGRRRDHQGQRRRAASTTSTSPTRRTGRSASTRPWRRSASSTSWSTMPGSAAARSTDLFDTAAWDKHHGRQRARRVFLGMKYAHPRDAEGRRRLDRQHLVDLRRHRPARHPCRLQRLEGRDPHDDQGRRGAARARQHPGQLGASRPDAADAHLRPHRRPGGARQDARTGADGPRRRASRRSQTRSCSSPRTRRPTSPAPSSYVDGGYLAT